MGQQVKVEPQVIAVLELLVSNAGETVRRDYLTEKIWDGRITSNSVIDSRIRAARAAIGDDGTRQELIKTFPNKGYRFVAPVTVEESLQSEPIDLVASEVSAASAKETAVRSSFWSKPVRAVPWAAIPIAGGIAVAFVTMSFGNTQQVPPSSGPAAMASGATISTDIYAGQSDEITDADVLVRVHPIEVIQKDPNAEPVIVETIRQGTASYLASIHGVRAAMSSPGSVVAGNNSDGMVYDLELSLLVDSTKSHLNVSLVAPEDGSLKWSRKYDLEGSAYEDRIARNIALSSANQLGLSTGQMDQSFVRFDAYSETRDALLLLRTGDIDNIAAARTILEKQVASEPDYLPAQAGLFFASWYGLNLAGEPFDTAIRDMKARYLIMREMAPEAPETLTALAKLVHTEAMSLEVETQTPLSLLEEATKKAPTYLQAQQDLAMLHANRGEFQLASDRFDRALVIHPSCPISLSGKSHAMSCLGNFEEAWGIAVTNARWNKDDVLGQADLATLGLQLGEYDTVSKVVEIMTKSDQLGYVQAEAVMEWYLSIGDYENAERFTFEAPEMAYVQAIRGDEEKARSSAAEMVGYYLSSLALQMTGNDQPMLKRTIVIANEATDQFYKPDADLSVCDLIYAMHEAFILTKHGHPAGDTIIANMASYFSDKTAAELTTLDQFIGLAGYHALTNDDDGAIAALRAGFERGFLFVHAFEYPIFEALSANPKFSELSYEMKQAASAYRSY